MPKTIPVACVADLLRHREFDLGQYLFIRAINTRPPKAKQAEGLDRSYPAGEVDL